MTRERYFEMISALNSQPIEDEIPIEYQDLPELVQTSLAIYESLQDEWEYMGGNYVGKKLQNLFEIFSLYSVPEHEQLLVYKVLSIIDKERSAIIREKLKAKENKKPGP